MVTDKMREKARMFIGGEWHDVTRAYTEAENLIRLAILHEKHCPGPSCDVNVRLLSDTLDRLMKEMEPDEESRIIGLRRMANVRWM